MIQIIYINIFYNKYVLIQVLGLIWYHIKLIWYDLVIEEVYSMRDFY